MHNAPLPAQRGRISGLVIFCVAMAALVLAIALGANRMFNRTFGAADEAGAVRPGSAASAPSGASAPDRAAERTGS